MWRSETRSTALYRPREADWESASRAVPTQDRPGRAGIGTRKGHERSGHLSVTDLMPFAPALRIERMAALGSVDEALGVIAALPATLRSEALDRSRV